MLAMSPSLASAVSGLNDGGRSWRGCRTLPNLFQLAMTDWPNNSFLGTRYKRADGRPGPCYEWESYREVELSITAIARSLRCLLGDTAGPRMSSIILGPISPASAKIHQALCHISAVPVFVTPEVTHQQLQLVIQSLDAKVVFLHQDYQRLLEAAVTVIGNEAGEAQVVGTAAAPAGTAMGLPVCEQLQLVVVWGAGGIKYTQPSADLLRAFGGAVSASDATDLAPGGVADVEAASAGGGAKIVGFEDFKRSHFNQLNNPTAAFVDMILPKPTDLAAVVVTAAETATLEARGEDTAESTPADFQAVLPEAAVQDLLRAGLSVTSLKHDELVCRAAVLLRGKFPVLEQTLAPYDPDHAEEYTGRPQFPTTLCTGVADVQQLVKIAAATAAAGRIGFSDAPDAVVDREASDASVLQPNL